VAQSSSAFKSLSREERIVFDDSYSQIKMAFIKASYYHVTFKIAIESQIIESSFSISKEGKAIFPDHYGQILQQLLLPSLDALSLYGNSYDHFNSKKYFNLLSGWGHISTIELLLQSRTDISADDVGQALEHVAEGGHTLIIEPFLKRNTEIYADHIGLALRYVEKMIEQKHDSIT
jgi:hypothetical protein